MEFKKNNLRSLFSYYSYAVTIFLKLLDLLPPFLRNLVLKLCLKKMGNNVFIDYGIYFRFPSKIVLGDNITIGQGCKFFPSFFDKESKIIIGNNVRIGPSVSFQSAGHDHSFLHLPDTGGTIEVKDNVWIGAGSILLQGIIVEEGAVIASGSVVTKDVNQYEIVGGTPAKFLKTRLIH